MAEVDLFAALSEDQRREIASATSVRIFRDGEAIVRQGAPEDHRADRFLAAIARRTELDQIRSAAQSSTVADVPATFVARMRKFLRL